MIPAEVLPDPSPWETGMEHAMWLVLFIGAVIALIKGFRAWDEHRIQKKAECIEAGRRAVEDRAVLYGIKKELHPNGGSSVRDALDQVSEQVKELSEDHRDLHDRIDWVYEHLFQQTQRQQDLDKRIDRPEPHDDAV